MTVQELTVGRKVKSNRGFAGVPKGTLGVIIEQPNSWPSYPSVAIQWQRTPDDKLIDWFSFDDLQYLDI